MPPRHPSRQKFKQKSLLGYLSSPPSSPSNSFPKSPSRPMRNRTRETSSSSSSSVADADSDVNAIHFEPEHIDISDEDHSPRRPRRRRSLSGAHNIPSRASSDESLDTTIGELLHRKRKHKVVLDSDDDTRPPKRKFIKGVRRATPEEEDDVLEEGNLVENRLRSRGKKTTYQKGLEKLKMKRSAMVLETEAEQSDDSIDIPFKGAKPHHSGDSDPSLEGTDSSSEEDDDGFIVDDDVQGASAAQLPPAFSMSTHQDLTHQFKIVCQLFVHLAVRPLVDRRPFFEHALKEEYLSVPLQVTRRKLCGIRDPLASSVWKSDFKRSLEKYPKFTLISLDFAIPQCDACHLGGRMSTLLGRLSGKPYDPYDFEDLSDEESDDDGDNNEDGGRGFREEFHLGRFCAARTRVYHQFSHWEYSLYKSLQLELTMAQDNPRRFATRPPRDLHDADRVMEWLDKRSIIDMEWQKLRRMMDSARNLEKGETDQLDVL